MRRSVSAAAADVASAPFFTTATEASFDSAASCACSPRRERRSSDDCKSVGCHFRSIAAHIAFLVVAVCRTAVTARASATIGVAVRRCGSCKLDQLNAATTNPLTSVECARSRVGRRRRTARRRAPAARRRARRTRPCRRRLMRPTVSVCIDDARNDERVVHLLAITE